MWVKGEKEKGKNIKVGYATVKIDDRWVNWEVTEKELEKRIVGMKER